MCSRKTPTCRPLSASTWYRLPRSQFSNTSAMCGYRTDNPKYRTMFACENAMHILFSTTYFSTCGDSGVESVTSECACASDVSEAVASECDNHAHQ